MAENKRDLTYLHVAIMFVIIFGFGLMKPIGEITPVGMKMVGIFISLLYGWSTIGMFLPSLIGWVAIGFSGIATVPQIVIQGFSNDIVIFLVFILVLVQMLIDSGAINNLTNWIITRKSLQGRPWLFSFVFLCSAGLLGTFGQAYAAFFLCWGILFNIFERIGYKPYQTYPAVMIIGVICVASPFGIMLPFKSMPLVILSMFTTATGIEVNYLQYMLVMVPTGMCMIIGYILACRFILRPDVSLLVNFDVETLKDANAAITKRQKAVLVAFGITLLLLLLPGSLPTSWPFIRALKAIGNT